MVILSRSEEQVLLSIWNLRDDAYLLSVKKHLTKKTGREWSLSSVQKPLLQLERKGYIDTFMGEATPVRGGRRKKLCRITRAGMESLKSLKKEQDVMWQEFINVELDRA